MTSAHPLHRSADQLGARGPTDEACIRKELGISRLAIAESSRSATHRRMSNKMSAIAATLVRGMPRQPSSRHDSVIKQILYVRASALQMKN